MRSTEKPSNPEAHLTFSTYNNTKTLDALHGQYYSNWQCLFYFRSVEKALVGITPLVALFCFILALLMVAVFLIRKKSSKSGLLSNCSKEMRSWRNLGVQHSRNFSLELCQGKCSSLLESIRTGQWTGNAINSKKNFRLISNNSMQEWPNWHDFLCVCIVY